MTAELTFPIDAEIVEERGLFRELRTKRRRNSTKTSDSCRRRTVVRQIVLFVVTRHDVAEAVAQLEVLANLVLRHHVDGKLGLLHVVLVVAVAVSENPIRIDITSIAEVLSKTVRVVGIRIVLTRELRCGVAHVQAAVFIIYVVCIRADERRLNQSQHIG